MAISDAEYIQLAMEADWLAEILANRLECCEGETDCNHDPDPFYQDRCAKCWRDYAKTMVETKMHMEQL